MVDEILFDRDLVLLGHLISHTTWHVLMHTHSTPGPWLFVIYNKSR